MKYRSRSEIVSMILNSLSAGPLTKSHITFRAYLSYAQLKEYISFMEQNDLIRYEQGTRVYRISEKGIKMMRLCRDLNDIVDSNKEQTPQIRI